MRHECCLQYEGGGRCPMREQMRVGAAQVAPAFLNKREEAFAEEG